jgi:hypothetical protein
MNGADGRRRTHPGKCIDILDQATIDGLEVRLARIKSESGIGFSVWLEVPTG